MSTSISVDSPRFFQDDYSLNMLYLTCGGVIALIGLDVMLHLSYDQTFLRLPTAFLTPLIAMLIIWQIWAFGKVASGLSPAEPYSPHQLDVQNKIHRHIRWLAPLGYLFIIGAASFDLSCTILNSPTLNDEGNPYIMALLSELKSIRLVYLYLAISQFFFILMFCAFWQAFLQHLPLVAWSIIVHQPKNLLEYLKAATGGAHLTWRQWLIPISKNELPLKYHYLWLLSTGVIFGISLFRIYAGLEWLEIVEISLVYRSFCIITGVFSSLFLYLIGLRYLTNYVSQT